MLNQRGKLPNKKKGKASRLFTSFCESAALLPDNPSCVTLCRAASICSAVLCFLCWRRWGLHMELELFWASNERLKLLNWQVSLASQPQVGRGRETKRNKLKASETAEDWINTDLCCVYFGAYIPDVGTGREWLHCTLLLLQVDPPTLHQWWRCIKRQ